MMTLPFSSLLRRATLLAGVAGLTLALQANAAQARDQIRIVGSSTVFPFVAAAAEQFGQSGEFKTPIVEATGTGGGFKLFCSGIGEQYPDLANASRKIKKSEVELCAKNGVKEITEIPIGYDGIVLANDLKSKTYDLTTQQLFLALARQVPKDGKLVPNPYEKWSDIDSSLPEEPIQVYGPPPTSGTRDAFVELVMEAGCKDLPEFEKAFPDEEQRKKACHLMREDGKYIDSGENDNIIVQKLTTNPHALGIFGYSFLEENASVVKGNKVNGVEPAFENITDGSYPVSRSLYVYAKDGQVDKVPGIREFLVELTSDAATGDEGYVTYKGLVPLHEDEREEVRTIARELKPTDFSNYKD